MSIDPKNAIISGLGAALIVGGYLAWKKHKATEKEHKEMRARVQELLNEVPEITKPSR